MFDPVHHGHLRLALEMRERLGLARVHLVPSASPPHRGAAQAGGADRADLVRAALGGRDDLVVDTRELDRGGTSYTVDTLAALRAEHPGEPLVFILGMDAYGALDTWHRWQELTNLAHLALARRPGARSPEGRPRELLDRLRVDNAPSLREKLSGNIIIVDVPMLDISSTRIRALFASGGDPAFLLPQPVIDLARARGLYLAGA
jgi:nicotinate-nucleotide adenylyltransferase